MSRAQALAIGASIAVHLAAAGYLAVQKFNPPVPKIDPETPPIVTPRAASLRSQANVRLSLKVAGLPPAQTIIRSRASGPAPNV
jgi:hypothetical protein